MKSECADSAAELVCSADNVRARDIQSIGWQQTQVQQSFVSPSFDATRELMDGGVVFDTRLTRLQ